MDCLHTTSSEEQAARANAVPLSQALANAHQAWSTGVAAMGLFIILVMLVLLGGCEGRVALFPNSDPALRKSPAEFAADAAKRFPYKADATRGGETAGRASIDYQLDLLQIANLSDEGWENIEVWINKKYVVFLPKVEKNAKEAKTLNFALLFDDQGHTFPTNNLTKESQIQSVEILRDGKFYDLRLALAD
jgi:hypothetical protein